MEVAKFQGEKGAQKVLMAYGTEKMHKNAFMKKH